MLINCKNICGLHKFYLIFFYLLSFFGVEVLSKNSNRIKALFDWNNINDMLVKLLLRDLPDTFPGTLWCGKGDTAEDLDDLGLFNETDLCCRTHDFCPDRIPSKQSKYGLTNDAHYTRLHCDCDQEFLKCLKEVKSRFQYPFAHFIGFTYFDFLKTKCFRYDYPVTKCIEYYPLKKKCKKYEYDNNKEKNWQWFDVPLFRSS